MALDELGSCDTHLPALAEQALALRLQIAEKAGACLLACEQVCILTKASAPTIDEQRFHEQKDLHSWIAARREPCVLSEAVNREVQVASLRTRRPSMSALVRGGVMPQPFLGRTVNVLLKRCQADDPIGRLDSDAHLVAIIGAGQMETVCSRSDRPAQDEPALRNLGCGGHRDSPSAASYGVTAYSVRIIAGTRATKPSIKLKSASSSMGSVTRRPSIPSICARWADFTSRMRPDGPEWRKQSGVGRSFRNANHGVTVVGRAIALTAARNVAGR